MKRGNTGRPDLPGSPKVARSSSRDSETDSVSTVSTVWLTSSNSSPSHSQPEDSAASSPRSNEGQQSSQSTDDTGCSNAGTCHSLPLSLVDSSCSDPVPGPSGYNWFEPSRTRSVSVSDSYNVQRRHQHFQNLVMDGDQHSIQVSHAESASHQPQKTSLLGLNRSTHHTISPLCLNDNGPSASVSSNYSQEITRPSNSNYATRLRSRSPLTAGGSRKRDTETATQSSTQGNLHSHSHSIFQARAGQTSVKNFSSGMSSLLAHDQVRPIPLSAYEDRDGNLFTNLSSRSALNRSSAMASSSPPSRIHMSRPDGVCLVPRRKSYSESTAICSLGLEGSSARSRGLPGLTGINSGYQALVSESSRVNSKSSPQAVLVTRAPITTSTSTTTSDPPARSLLWRQQVSQSTSAATANSLASSMSATVMSRHSYQPEAQGLGSSGQRLNTEPHPAIPPHHSNPDSSQSIRQGQQRMSLSYGQSNNLPSTPTISGDHFNQRALLPSHRLRLQETSSLPATSTFIQDLGQRDGQQGQPLTLSHTRQGVPGPGLNERLRLIYHTWSAAALANGEQHDLESPFTSTSLNPLTAVSVANLPYQNRSGMTRGPHSLFTSAVSQWPVGSLDTGGTEEERSSPVLDQSHQCEDLSSRNPSLLIKKAGPYILGPRIGSPPVRSVAQCLARKQGTNDFYCIKILTLPEPGQENMDERQGKMLLLTEFSLLSQLKDMAGVVHCQDFFKDTAWDPHLQKNVRRLCLVVDSLMPHDYDSNSHHLINLQHHVIQQRRLPEKEAVLIFWDIARIVQQLHKVNIVHRDLKLGNMVIDRRSWRVTLANFCLGKQLSSETDRLRDQRGSPAYISPDVLSGQPYFGKPSDMWALGVVLFTMLYGQFPFYDGMPQELFRKIKAAEYTIPNDGRVTEDTKMLIQQLLTIDSHQRLTAGQLVDALETIIGKWKGMLACETDQVVPDIPVKKEPDFQLEENDKVTQTEQTLPSATSVDKVGGQSSGLGSSGGYSAFSTGSSFPEATRSKLSLNGRPFMIKVSTSTARPMSPAEARAIRHLFTSARSGSSTQEHR